ncbi:aminoglycoside phosphotransferase family protein [Cribrihabitans pelagius]|uniref:aminoglycoside phosphotransferase family protein n=1 Tax=Cribrihabitans pelagius TaxID=1765746 RepID=UPI003B5C9A03
MLLFAEFDEPLIRSHVAEFLAASGRGGSFSVHCLHRSFDGERAQRVFAVRLEDGATVILKKNFNTPSRWIAREYHLFERLVPHFATAGACSIVKPLYLGRDESFHVTGFQAGRTATDVLRSAPPQAQANQVFRRAGRWLDHMHRLQPAGEESLTVDRVFERLQEQAAEGGRVLPCADAPLWAALQRDAGRVQGRPCPVVFAHGDYHSGNLILAPGTACGLDLAYAAEQPAIHNVTSFLLADLNLACDPAEIGPGAVRRQSVAFFFKTYRLPLDRALLNFLLRAGVLRELARVENRALACAQDHGQDQAKDQARIGYLRRAGTLRRRLTHAFAQPLDG